MLSQCSVLTLLGTSSNQETLHQKRKWPKRILIVVRDTTSEPSNVPSHHVVVEKVDSRLRSEQCYVLGTLVSRSRLFLDNGLNSSSIRARRVWVGAVKAVDAAGEGVGADAGAVAAIATVVT